MTSYTQLTDTLTFVIKQRTPTLFETYRIEQDADAKSVTLPVYFSSLEEAEAHRSKFIRMYFRNLPK